MYPRDSLCLSVLGVTYILRQQGNDIGIRLCQQALGIEPDNPDNSYRLAVACFLAGQTEKAYIAVQNCLRLNLHHLDAKLLLAEIELSKGLAHKPLRRLKHLQNKNILSQKQQEKVSSLLQAFAV